MIPNRETHRRLRALLRLNGGPGLADAIHRTAAPVDAGGLGLDPRTLMARIGCWWAPVRPEGADRFDVDSGGAWALLLPVHDAVAFEGDQPENRIWHFDECDIVDVLALPLPDGRRPGHLRPGWRGRTWRCYAGTVDAIGPWALGLGGGPEVAAPRLYRDPLSWLTAGAPLPWSAVVLHWTRPVMSGLAGCEPIAEDRTHAADIARRLRDFALADLPQVRFPTAAMARAA